VRSGEIQSAVNDVDRSLNGTLPDQHAEKSQFINFSMAVSVVFALSLDNRQDNIILCLTLAE